MSVVHFRSFTLEVISLVLMIGENRYLKNFGQTNIWSACSVEPEVEIIAEEDLLVNFNESRNCKEKFLILESFD